MHISRETIEQLYKHYEELDALQEQASDNTVSVNA